MTDSFLAEKYKLDRNPFPPAATGIDIEKDLYLPSKWKDILEEHYSMLSTSGGAKAFPIIGEYGSGKTVLLKGYLKPFFEGKRIKPFYFENPGVQFYDLANALLRDLGRYEFSKALWELCRSDQQYSGQTTLVPMDFDKMLSNLKTKKEKDQKASEIAKIIKNGIKLTDDEEIAYRFALMIVETGNKPYFEYRDFIAGQKEALVAEGEEHKYFNTVIKAIIDIYRVEGVAFLIDEFEDIAIPKRRPRSKSYEYLATLRRLIDISEKENLWITIAMTHEAAKATQDMNPPLWERFTHNERTTLNLEPLSVEDSKDLIQWWLIRAREDKTQSRHYSDSRMI